MEISDFDKRYDAFRKYMLSEFVECASREQIWQWCYFNVVWDETIRTAQDDLEENATKGE